MYKYLKFILPLLISLLLGWFLMRQGIHWNDLLSVLRQSKWSLLLLAIIWEALSFGAVTYLNQILLRAHGATVPYGKQFVVQLAMSFVEAVVPSASISGFVLRSRLLRSHRVLPDVAAVTVITEGFLIFISILLPTILVAGITFANGAQVFNGVIPWLVFLLIVVIIISVLMWRWNTASFSSFRTRQVQRIGDLWDRQIQPRWFKQLHTWPSHRIFQRLAQLWADTAFSVRYRPYAILLCLATRFVFEALCLMMCFHALGQSLPIITFLPVYALTITINTLGAVPGGVGLAEVSLAALYSQLGISTELAVAVALAYRITGYWFPRVVGGLAWLWMERQGLQKSISEGVP